MHKSEYAFPAASEKLINQMDELIKFGFMTYDTHLCTFQQKEMHRHVCCLFVLKDFLTGLGESVCWPRKKKK